MSIEEPIRVHTKHFSMSLIKHMFEVKDMTLEPLPEPLSDYQGTNSWNNLQKSRWIESLILGIPTPMFCFYEGNDDKLRIFDGLQRILAIKEFIDNTFPLRKLEYLMASCEGRYHTDDGDKKGLPPKYKRWFYVTSFLVHVIDPSNSPEVVNSLFMRYQTNKHRALYIPQKRKKRG